MVMNYFEEGKLKFNNSNNNNNNKNLSNTFSGPCKSFYIIVLGSYVYFCYALGVMYVL